MAAAKRSSGDVYVCTESGSTEIDGQVLPYTKGITRVRAGHPLLKAVPDRFEPIDLTVHYDVEQATAAPGERRAG